MTSHQMNHTTHITSLMFNIADGIHNRILTTNCRIRIRTSNPHWTSLKNFISNRSNKRTSVHLIIFITCVWYHPMTKRRIWGGILSMKWRHAYLVRIRVRHIRITLIIFFLYIVSTRQVHNKVLQNFFCINYRSLEAWC